MSNKILSQRASTTKRNRRPRSAALIDRRAQIELQAIQFLIRDEQAKILYALRKRDHQQIYESTLTIGNLLVAADSVNETSHAMVMMAHGMKEGMYEELRSQQLQ